MVAALLFFYKISLNCKTVLLGPDNLELSIVSFHMSSCRICIALFYRPPSSPVSVIESLYSIFLSLDPALFSNFIFLGDFNIDFYNPTHPLFNK